MLCMRIRLGTSEVLIKRRDECPVSVTACLAKLGRPASDWEGIVASRLNSRIHRAGDGDNAIAIKECFDPATREANAASAEREFNALRRIRMAAALDRAIPAPVPLALCRDQGVYAMSWAGGISATQAILASADSEQATRLGMATGTWLRNFHSLHMLPRRCNDFDGKLRVMREARARMQRRDALVDRTIDALAATAATATSVELPASWIHGDMKSDNLLVDGQHVVGLDLQLIDENTVVYDLAPFLNHLYLLAWSARGLVRRNELRLMSAHFLATYSAETAAWALPLAWLRAYLLVQIVASPSRAGRLRTRFARWPVARELTNVVNTLESS